MHKNENIIPSKWTVGSALLLPPGMLFLSGPTMSTIVCSAPTLGRDTCCNTGRLFFSAYLEKKKEKKEQTLQFIFLNMEHLLLIIFLKKKLTKQNKYFFSSQISLIP